MPLKLKVKHTFPLCRVIDCESVILVQSVSFCLVQFKRPLKGESPLKIRFPKICFGKDWLSKLGFSKLVTVLASWPLLAAVTSSL